MRTYQQWRTYQDLELLTPFELTTLTYKPTGLSLLHKIWFHWRDSLNLDNEPRIREITDRWGKTWWKIYDPVSDQSLQLDSVRDVLVWLEERHHPRSQTSSWDGYTHW